MSRRSNAHCTRGCGETVGQRAAVRGQFPYLESDGISVPEGTEDGEERKGKSGSEIVGEWSKGYELRACRCKMRFCSSCCRGLGIALSKELVPVLETFDGIMMLTLTVDPKLFESPQAAFEYVRRRRCVAKLVDELHRAGHLVSRRYFYVVEWQKETEMAHWHVLVEANFVPFLALVSAWDRFRPSWAGPAVPGKPGFGSVNFKKSRFESPLHAARYACKYLTKAPEHGYPDWVMDYRGQIKRYSASRGFFPNRGRRPQERLPCKPKVHDEAGPPHAETCFCEKCRGEGAVASSPKVSTIRERLERCGRGAVVVEVAEGLRRDGEIVKLRPRFVGMVGVGFQQALALLGVTFDGQRVVGVTSAELGVLWRASRDGGGVQFGAGRGQEIVTAVT